MLADPIGVEPYNLDRAEIERRATRIRMIGAFWVRNQDGPALLYYLESRPLGHGFWMISADREARDLEYFATIITRHAIRGDGSFDPTREGYYTQIPAELLDEVAAIEHDDLNVIVVDDAHQAQTRLYRNRKA